jgi:low temperature requirement protein LtrA
MLRTPLHVPMTGRSPHESHRVATPLELFFDLVFVVALARAASVLHHAIAEGHAADGVLVFTMAFFGIWWAWMNFTWFASAYDTDDVPYRLLVFLQMTGALVFAAGVGEAFARQDFRLGVLGYVLMRVAMVAQWLRASRQDPEHRGTSLRYAAGIALVQLAWVAFLWVPLAARIPVFGLLCLVELLVPVWAEQTRMTSWHSHHIAERYGLFVIIVLGESVLAGSLAIEAVAASGLTMDLAAVVGGALLIMFAMWWLYFDGLPTSLLSSFRGAFIWGYGHFVVLGSAAAVGASIAVAADFTTEHAEISALAAVMAIAVPVACYLGSLWLLHLVSGERDASLWWVPITVVLVMLASQAPHSTLVIGLILVGLIAAKLVRRHVLTRARAVAGRVGEGSAG